MIDYEYIKQLEESNEQLQKELGILQSKLSFGCTEEILRTLIQQKEDYIREKKSEIIKNWSTRMVVEDICTIKFNVGRQHGHTTALVNICTSRPDDSIIIARSMMALKMYPKNLAMTWDHFKTPGVRYTKNLILIDDGLSGYMTYEDMRDILGQSCLYGGTIPIIVLT